MTEKQFVTRFAWINLPILVFTCSLNYWIDGASTHHLPGEVGFLPRTTKHSALSKLHYLSIENPGTIYFGSSRVEVGLPANPDLVGGGVVYNAGLSGASLGQLAPFIKHNLAFTDPKKIVIGIDFGSFTAKAGASDLDLSMLSTNYINYLAKKISHDLSQSLSIKATQESIKAITASYKDEAYDGLGGSRSNLGQATTALMQRENEYDEVAEFQKRLKQAFSPPSKDIADEKSWLMFNSLVEEICHKNIVTRIYIHPTHALTMDAIRQSGKWSEFEQWKIDLANLATRYQLQQCDLKIIDFSGYNSINTETIRDWSPTSTLNNYWEVSHYKSIVGEMILKRLFLPTAPDEIPQDFGRELLHDSVADVLTAIREEQSRYFISHSEDIKLSQQWMTTVKGMKYPCRNDKTKGVCSIRIPISNTN
jgi:hypothetical protein